MTARDFIKNNGLETEIKEAFRSIQANGPRVDAARDKFREDKEASDAVLKANMNLSFAYMRYEDACKAAGERPITFEDFKEQAKRV